MQERLAIDHEDLTTRDHDFAEEDTFWNGGGHQILYLAVYDMTWEE
jgi:hypothetical protein